MKETEYDRMMKLGEDEYLRLSKEGDPYAFHKAVEMVNRLPESGAVGVRSLPMGKKLRDLARQYAEDKFGGMGSDISLTIIQLAESDFQKTVFWLKEKGF